jgi:hypothetical protein
MTEPPQPQDSSADTELLAQGDGWEHWQCGTMRWWTVSFRDGGYRRSRPVLERHLRRGTEPVIFVIPKLKDLDSPSLGGLLMCIENGQKINRWIGLVGEQAASRVKVVLKMMGAPAGTLNEFSCLESAEAALLRCSRLNRNEGRKRP